MIMIIRVFPILYLIRLIRQIRWIKHDQLSITEVYRSFSMLLTHSLLFSVMVSIPDCSSVDSGFKPHKSLFNIRLFFYLTSWFRWIFKLKIGKTQLRLFHIVSIIRVTQLCTLSTCHPEEQNPWLEMSANPDGNGFLTYTRRNQYARKVAQAAATAVAEPAITFNSALQNLLLSLRSMPQLDSTLDSRHLQLYK